MKKLSENFLLWNNAVEPSSAFIVIDGKMLAAPSQYVSFKSLCFRWEKCFISWFSYEYKLFLKDLYSTHYSQEFCITWMLLIYFLILNRCLFKQISNIYVHAVCLDKLFQAVALSQYSVWKTARRSSRHSLRCLSLCTPFSIKCCWVTAWWHAASEWCTVFQNDS